MSLRHPKPAPATPSAGKRALPIRCGLLLVATLEHAGELVAQRGGLLAGEHANQVNADRRDRAQCGFRPWPVKLDEAGLVRSAGERVG